MAKTNVKILDDNFKSEATPIKFNHHIRINSNCLGDIIYKPKAYQNIELIALDYYQGYDLMFAYDNCRKNGTLILGVFNSGMVEE